MKTAVPPNMCGSNKCILVDININIHVFLLTFMSHLYDDTEPCTELTIREFVNS